jgi:Flp pilus assembly protein TadG
MKHSQRGTSMAEFAVAASALLLFLFGIIEFARVLDMYHTVSNAARIGSRWAIVRGADCNTLSPSAALDHCPAAASDIQSYVQSVVPIVDSGSLQVTTQWSSTAGPSAACDGDNTNGNNGKGHVVCVTVSYPFNFAIPFVSTTPLTLTSTSQMVIAN